MTGNVRKSAGQIAKNAGARARGRAQAIADRVGVDSGRANEWRALHLLERLLGDPPVTEQRVAEAWAALASCTAPARPHYAADLLAALGFPALALRQLHPVILPGPHSALAEPTAADVRVCVAMLARPARKTRTPEVAATRFASKAAATALYLCRARVAAKDHIFADASLSLPQKIP